VLIFLDIDGVMVPAKSWKVPETLKEDGFPVFSRKATEALKQLISKDANTRIILSTSHRHRFAIDEWKEIFKRRCIVINKLGILTVSHHGPTKRKDEILGWLNSHEVVDNNFVIIDDDTTLNGLPAHVKRNLILTSPMIGLTSENLAQVSDNSDNLLFGL
jgi:hypothetical protein